MPPRPTQAKPCGGSRWHHRTFLARPFILTPKLQLPTFKTEMKGPLYPKAPLALGTPTQLV